MGEILGTTVIRKRGEITIPVEVRKYLGLKPGDNITLFFDDGKVIVKKTEVVHKDFKIKR